MRTRGIVAIALLAFALSASAATISGRAVMTDGTPLPGVIVKLSDGQEFVTQLEGRFSFEVTSPSGLVLSTRFEGFKMVDQTLCASSAPQVFELVLSVDVIDDCTTPLGYELPKHGRIDCAVKDLNGRAIPQAVVRVKGVRSDTAKTSGRVTFPNVPLGDYIVEASAPGFRPNAAIVRIQTCLSEQHLTLPLSPACTVLGN